MGLFKNSVGRPSNEILKKRKIFYALIFLIVICVIGIGTFYVKNHFSGEVGSKSKNAATTCYQPYNITACENEWYYGRPQKDLIKKLQEMLKEAGYHYGYVNGNYGSYTVDAVRRAQRAFGLQQTGQADYQLVEKMAPMYNYGWTVITYNKNGGTGTLIGTSNSKQFLMRANSPLISARLSKSNATHVGWTATSTDRSNSNIVYYYGCSSKNCTKPTMYTQAQKNSLGSKFVSYVFTPGEMVNSDIFNSLNGVRVNFNAYYCNGTGAKYTKSTSTCSGGKTSNSSAKPNANANVTIASYSLQGTKKALLLNNKYYTTNTNINFSSISSSNYVYTYAGNSIKIIGKFASGFYSGYKGQVCNGKTYPKMKVTFYTYKNGKAVAINGKDITKRINSSSISIEMAIPSNVEYMTINTYEASKNCNDNSYGTYLKNYSKAIYLNVVPSITVTSKTSGASKTSTSNNYDVSSFKKYSTSFNISKSNSKKYYYKYFAFDGTISGTSAISESSCKEIKNNLTFTEKANITNYYTKIVQYVRVYADKNTCDSDTTKVSGKIAKKSLNSALQFKNNTAANYLNAISIMYNYPLTTTNSSGYKVLKYDINKLSKQIGSQSKAECHYYSIAYGSFIQLGNSKPKLVRDYTPTVVAYDSSQFGGCYVDSLSDRNCKVDLPSSLNYSTEYATIIKKINKGIPVVIHTKNNMGEHWVLVVGYNSKKTSISNIGSELLKNVWIIDPYSDYGYNNRKNTLWQGIGSNRYTCRSMLNANYRTWDIRRNAK